MAALKRHPELPISRATAKEGSSKCNVCDWVKREQPSKGRRGINDPVKKVKDSVWSSSTLTDQQRHFHGQGRTQRRRLFGGCGWASTSRHGKKWVTHLAAGLRWDAETKCRRRRDENKDPLPLEVRHRLLAFRWRDRWSRTLSVLYLQCYWAQTIDATTLCVSKARVVGENTNRILALIPTDSAAIKAFPVDEVPPASTTLWILEEKALVGDHGFQRLVSKRIHAKFY